MNNVNQAPVLDAIGAQSVDENSLLRIRLSATDIDGDRLTYSASDLPDGANFNPASHIFSWTPGYDQAGSYNITFSVTDGSLSDSETVTITVNNVVRRYRLSITAENGVVAKSPDQELYNEGATVTVTAVPNAGYTFINWSGDLSGANNTATILMDGDKSITAAFVDSTAPGNCSVVINGGSEYTNNPTVQLAIQATDLGSGLRYMQFSNDGSNWLSRQNYAISERITLPSGDGVKTVYVRVIDRAGNESAVFSDSIILDTTAPHAPMLNAVPARTRYPELTLSGTKEANSGILVNGQGAASVNASADWSCVVRLAEGENVLSIVSYDAAGNRSPAISATVTLKTIVRIRIISPLKRFLSAKDLIAGTNDVAILYLVDDNTTPLARRVTLEDGRQSSFTITAEDDLGNIGEETITLGLHLRSPSIAITNYHDGQTVTSPNITLMGEVADTGSGIQYVKVNGKPATVSANTFRSGLNLGEGVNNIVAEAVDNADNNSSTSLNLTYAPPAPVVTTTEPAITTITEESKPVETTTHSIIYVAPTVTKPGTEATIGENTETKNIPKSNLTQIIRKKGAAIEQKGQEEPMAQRQEVLPYNPPAYYEEQTQAMPKIKEIKEKPTAKVEAPAQKTILPPLRAQAEEITPSVKINKVGRFFIFRIYRLKVENLDQELALWKLAKKQRLPFGLKLDGKKGVIFGFVLGKKDINLKFDILIPDGTDRKVECSLKLE